MQITNDHEVTMLAEAQKRKESVESMGDMMNGITERLNEQQTKMEETCKENDDLRSQLRKIAEVLPCALVCMIFWWEAARTICARLDAGHAL